MYKERYRVRQLECCDKQMFGNLIVTCPTYASEMPKTSIQPVPITVKPVATPEEIVRRHMMEAERRRASMSVDQLSSDIHNSIQHTTDYNSTTSGRSSQKYSRQMSHDLWKRDIEDLSALVVSSGGQIERVGVKLVRRLKRREALRRQQEANCDVITCQSKKLSPNSSEEMCFTVNPQAEESGFSQWVSAMKMVAQLPGGIPPEFRKRLWSTMAEKHLASKGVDWNKVERTCFSEWAHPEDGELGVQIVKDSHRTGCSSFCGEGGQENQALSKKVSLAYARWNKAVGYCQGFNMLAASILQVVDKSETDASKLMIYLIEGVSPDSYFADSLRGSSVDMAVFRESLRTRSPRLSKHSDLSQNLSKEGTTSYEPPLTNVFTMQWFLTLFCNCLPQPSVLRVWDLISSEGNEILLRTALAIWQTSAEKILRVRSADEFYCIMGLLTTESLENNLIDANSLIKAVVSVGPLTESKSLRDHYLYNINPLGPMSTNLGISDKQLKIYPKERIASDISTLKKQYMKLRQRQRQAHIIFSAAINRQPPSKAPVAMNHLLLGKSALVPSKRLGPPKGSIPPARVPTTLHWKDTKQTSSSSSSDTELCDDNNPPSDSSDEESNRKSPVPDLPEDNSNPSDTIEAEDSQKPPACVEATDNIGNQKSDILETLVHSEFGVAKIADVDSEDDSTDFESFLEDRVKSLKDGEDKRVTLSRRNSERASQIIQENSLILHRILQCQSRLSSSPPSTETGNDPDEESASKKFQDPVGDETESASCSDSIFNAKGESQSDSWKVEVHSDISDYDSPKTPKDEYCFPSKYQDISTKSKSLNEKCDGLFNTSYIPAQLEERLPESKTFTNQDESIDFTSDCSEKKKYTNDFEYDENKIRPWLETIDLNLNTEYPQDIKGAEDLTPQQNFSYDFKTITGSNGTSSEVKVDQPPKIIPDMIVSFSGSRKNSENENNVLSDVDSEWTKKFLSSRQKGTDGNEATPSGFISKLESQNTISADRISERRSLSATNSVDKTEKVNERKSLSATNSMERTSSPSRDPTKEDCSERYRRKSPDIPYESYIPSPSRSRLSSSNSREFTSPLNESSISISSRVTSPSPERDYEIHRRLSPRKTYNSSKEDTREFLFEETTNMGRSKSPQKPFEMVEDPRDSSEYRNYRESKDRIERKLYGDPVEQSSKDFSSSSENIGSSSKEFHSSSEGISCSQSLKSPDKRLEEPKTYSRNLDLRSSSCSPLRNSSLTHEELGKRSLFDGNQDAKKSYAQDDDYKFRSSVSPKPDTGSYSSRSSPLLRYEGARDSLSPKSPNKVFNPFPVPLNSRQNKEIGVKLGSYKK